MRIDVAIIACAILGTTLLAAPRVRAEAPAATSPSTTAPGPAAAGTTSLGTTSPGTTAPGTIGPTPAAVPEVMPFDIPYGTPIDMDEAHKAIMGAVAEAKKHNWKMSISVVDPGGNLIAHATMNGTQYGSIAVSQAKARTAALFRRPSGVLQAAVNTGGSPSLLSLLALNGAVASEGGFPIVIDGKLIGAIGASGGVFTQDAVVGKAGLEAVGAK